jgi:hypothetical protein
MSRVVSNRSNIVRNSSSVTGFPVAAGAVVLGGSVAEVSFHIDRLQYRVRLMCLATARLFLGLYDLKLVALQAEKVAGIRSPRLPLLCFQKLIWTSATLNGFTFFPGEQP